MDEESGIYQRVRSGAPVLVDQDVEAFCGRGDDGTVVIGVSLSVSQYLKMNGRFHEGGAMKKTKKAKVVKVKDFDSMTVSQVMEKEVQFVRMKTKGDVIASLMIEGFGAVPVVENGRKLAGIVSEHDLLTAVDDGHKLSAVSAKDVMTSNPYSVLAETTLGTLVHVLRASDLVRVPVVNKKDRLIGIIARRDILRTYLATGGKREQ